MAKKKNKKLDLTKPVEQPRMPFAVMVRMFLIGAVSVGAAAYGIYRHYTVPRAPMLVPVPVSSSSAEPLSPDLIPVPDLVPVPPAADR